MTNKEKLSSKFAEAIGRAFPKAGREQVEKVSRLFVEVVERMSTEDEEIAQMPDLTSAPKEVRDTYVNGVVQIITDLCVNAFKICGIKSLIRATVEHPETGQVYHFRFWKGRNLSTKGK